MTARALVFGTAAEAHERHRLGRASVVRTNLLHRIGAVLPDEVEVDATVRVHLARRV